MLQGNYSTAGSLQNYITYLDLTNLACDRGAKSGGDKFPQLLFHLLVKVDCFHGSPLNRIPPCDLSKLNGTRQVPCCR